MDIENDAPAGSPNDDLRSTLAAAVAQHSEPSETPATSAPAAEADPKGSMTAAERARDASGRFAPKDSATPAPTVDATKPENQADVSTETATAATRKAPAAWSKEHQDAFATLPPAIQDQILKRETDVARGFQDRAEKVRQAEDFERVAGQYRPNFERLGLTPLQAADRLFAVERELQRDPAGAIAKIAQAYGVRLPGVPQPSAQAPQQSALEQRLAAMEAAQRQREQQEHERVLEDHRTSIAKFAAENEHFETLKPLMGKLIATGQAEGLKDAYEKAAWLDPATRQAMIAKQTAPAAAAQRAQAGQAAADRARAAASSLKGAPSGGTSSVSPTAPKATLREEIEANFKGR